MAEYKRARNKDFFKQGKHAIKIQTNVHVNEYKLIPTLDMNFWW